MSKNFILKFEDVSVQPSKLIEGTFMRRAIGFVGLQQILPLLDSKSLAPNPRSAKRNTVIEAILGTLNDAPELFRYKSRGLLISSHKVEELERKRFRVTIEKEFVDGILDGGHNMFAIAIFLLSQILEDRELKKVRTWEQLDRVWAEHRAKVEGLEFDSDALVAVELLFPTSANSEVQDLFDQASFDISQARNTNTQVKTEAFQNKLGFYDVLKDALPNELSSRVEWKPGVVEANDVKPINVRDIVALAWIPLNFANSKDLLPFDISVTPQNIYRNKGECSEKFNTLMISDSVTKPIGGKAGQARQLSHKAIESSLTIASDIPRLFDLIYEHFPRFYNAGGFRFGRRDVVKMYNPTRVKELRADKKEVSGYTSTRPVTPFFQRHSSVLDCKYPEGLILPFVTGLSALLKVEDGKVRWVSDDIDAHVLTQLKKAAPLYDGQLDAYNFDPQKVAKSASSHNQVASYYKVL